MPRRRGTPITRNPCNQPTIDWAIAAYYCCVVLGDANHKMAFGNILQMCSVTHRNEPRRLSISQKDQQVNFVFKRQLERSIPSNFIFWRNQPGRFLSRCRLNTKFTYWSFCEILNILDSFQIKDHICIPESGQHVAKSHLVTSIPQNGTAITCSNGPVNGELIQWNSSSGSSTSYWHF